MVPLVTNLKSIRGPPNLFESPCHHIHIQKPCSQKLCRQNELSYLLVQGENVVSLFVLRQGEILAETSKIVHSVTVQGKEGEKEKEKT